MNSITAPSHEICTEARTKKKSPILQTKLKKQLRNEIRTEKNNAKVSYFISKDMDDSNSKLYSISTVERSNQMYRFEQRVCDLNDSDSTRTVALEDQFVAYSCIPEWNYLRYFCTDESQPYIYSKPLSFKCRHLRKVTRRFADKVAEKAKRETEREFGSFSYYTVVECIYIFTSVLFIC